METHVRTLFNGYHMKPILEASYVCCPTTDLWVKLKWSKAIQIEIKLQEASTSVKGIQTNDQRYKGLEWTATNWETTDPEHRPMARVPVDDAAEADKIFDMLIDRTHRGIYRRKRHLVLDVKMWNSSLV